MKPLNALDYIAFVILIIGGLNWGLVGIFQYNVIATLFGDMTTFSRIIYDIVALAAVYVAVITMNLQKKM